MALALSRQQPPTGLRDWLARSWRDNPPLTFTGIVMVLVLGATLVGLVVDPRQIINEPVWLKPAKFAISIAIYSFTFLERRRGLVLAMSWVIAGVFVLEEAIISYQALRGVRSHFNYTTAFDSALFQTMAIAIVVLWVANLVIGVLLLRQRLPNPVLAWGLRFGLLTAVLGMAVAFFMPQPTPAQIERMQAEEQVAIIGAHSVGVEDGGPGLPVVGWSTVGGDLRVAHFVGIHGLQALPIIAWLLTKLPVPWLSVAARTRLVIIAGVGGVGLVGLLTWQALRGQPLIAPDELTLAVLFGGLAVLGLAAAAIVGNAGRRAGAPAV